MRDYFASLSSYMFNIAPCSLLIYLVYIHRSGPGGVSDWAAAPAVLSAAPLIPETPFCVGPCLRLHGVRVRFQQPTTLANS